MTDRQNEVYAKLSDLVAATFDLEEVLLTPHAVANDFAGWDSLGHVRLMFAIEEAFGIRFAVAEVARLRNVGMLVDAILARIGTR